MRKMEVIKKFHLPYSSLTINSIYHFLLFHSNPFWIQFFYFTSISAFGFLVLKLLPTRSESERPPDLDLFFMSSSANMVASMNTIEMEVFSNSQLVVLTILMLLGGEVFISMLGLHLMRIRSKKELVSSHSSSSSSSNSSSVALELTSKDLIITSDHHVTDQLEVGKSDWKYSCVRQLSYVVLGYLLLVHMVGYTLISLYLTLIPSARQVLESKGIQANTFAFFATVSSFSNCGFLPTNESMIVFKNCSGLLLIVVSQVLAGNTMFPTFLRSVIWVLGRVTKKVEYDGILSDHGENIGYKHLLPGLHSLLLALTVVGFVVAQFVLFLCMEWNSVGLDDMSPYRKLVGAFFMSVNTRHAGESIVDISTLSKATLVLYVVMMYLPSYTSFLPFDEDHATQRDGKQRRGILQDLFLSQLSYLVIFVIIICITERDQLSEDPLNFNVLNIVIEVISAYGGVGFSTGYSCERRLTVTGDKHCKDLWVGLVGKWSRKGKLTLIAVMLFGRLKKFNMGGGKAWKVT
ncbi:cation transporter HKT1;5-like [Typha latifolia]|uniref:cation transporter HKT1;5-like n=1 Tax=Typha latifolia TaxID=4733 RepID=UPI003C2F14C4